jgi:hypothetical protein
MCLSIRLSTCLFFYMTIYQQVTITTLFTAEFQLRTIGMLGIRSGNQAAKILAW